MSSEVQLWSARLDPPSHRVEALTAILSDEELARAAAFRFERDRRRFIVAHGILRHVIAAAAGIAPQEAMFGCGPSGKPIVIWPDHGGVHFSLSHSEERCLIGVSRTVPLGVDLERVRELPDCASIAKRLFSPCDRRAVEILPPRERAGSFLGCWTRTEAYVKALGVGLAGAYERRGNPCWACAGRRCGQAGAASTLGEWSVVPLEPEIGYVAAVATPTTVGLPTERRLRMVLNPLGQGTSVGAKVRRTTSRRPERRRGDTARGGGDDW
jgi:4'-phosphopantetheinyl transferase